MKLKKKFLISLIVLSGLFLGNLNALEIDQKDLDLITTKYVESKEVIARYEAMTEASKSEMLWLRLENIGLKVLLVFLVIK
jgi:hypothetical protein